MRNTLSLVSSLLRRRLQLNCLLVGSLAVSLLSGCATGDHFYAAPENATVEIAGTTYSGRGEGSLDETYRLSAVDGKVVRFRFDPERVVPVTPGSHKLIVNARIKRGNFLFASPKYYDLVIEAELQPGGCYRVTGTPKFVENDLFVWVEKCGSREQVSREGKVSLSTPLQRDSPVYVPIYVPAVKGR